jgi:long-chain fatty acid transport protein
MKKLTFVAAFFMLAQLAIAGGLLTNTNQSAQFVRMLSRNASLGIDAVYYNPAGLIKMGDGWHFALSSQTIFQTKTVDSNFGLLNDGYYEGAVSVPVFPTGYAVYKNNNWAFSFGFGPNAGGGSASYERGLPSFEIPISKIVPALSGLSQINPALNVTGYNANLAFEGSSIFWGIQLGATYKLNDVFSVYGGLRYLPSKNTYAGSIQNIQLNVGGEMVSAPTWLPQAAGVVSGVAVQAAAGAAQYDAAAATASTLSGNLAAAIEAGYINPNDPLSDPQLIGALQQFGVDPSGFTNAVAAGAFSQVASTLSGEADKLYGTADQLNATASTLENTAELLEDKEVETEQTGSGITPMIGLNISPAENFNIALRYEMETKLQLTNSTTVDDLGLFPDGKSTGNDIPAILGVGLGYNMGLVEAQLSYTMFFDKGINTWGYNTRDIAIWEGVDDSEIRHRKIDNNGVELGLGLQFNVSKNFAFSLGGLYSNLGVAESYQSDFDNNLSSFTLGGGIEYQISDVLKLDAGLLRSFYKDQKVPFNDPDISSYSETFGKSTLDFAIGLSYSIFQ